MKILKRKTLAALLALSLLASLLPIGAQPALAADGDQTVCVGGVALSGATDSPAYATTDTSGKVVTGGANADNYNIMWDGSTLTLKNATIKEAAEYGSNNESMAVYRESGDLALSLVGKNTVDAPGDGPAASCGINVSGGSLTISGEENASLSVFGGATTSGNSYGIYASDTITIDSGAVSATGKSAANGRSYGIYTPRDITINGGSVTANSNEASSQSMDICAFSGDVTINGGSVTATAGKAGGDSIGIYTDDANIFINGGTVNATAGDAVGEGWHSCGINGRITITINGGTVTARGGNADGTGTESASTGMFTQGDVIISDGDVTGIGGTGRISYGISSNQTLKITGGTVEGRGGSLSGNGVENYGIFGAFNVEITGGTVTGTGGDTDIGDSFGVGVDYTRGQKVSITGGTVTAKGGSAASGDSCGIYAGNTNDEDVEVAITGGMVTATGGAAAAGSYGILVEHNGTNTSATVTINGNSVVRANMTGEKGDDGEPISGKTIEKESSIVFENGVGTVYGNVTLQENLTIETGESLDIPEGSSLTIPDGKTLTVIGGELTGNVPQNGVIYKVTGVSLDKTALTLIEGESEQLTATVAPSNATDQAVTWHSDNTAVATVDNSGKVTAVSPGTAKITATTADGSYTAECQVTVTAKTYSLSADKSTLNFGSITEGDALPAAQTVTVKNTGNQTVTLEQPASTNSFVVGALSAKELEPNASARFTIQPKDNLSRGSYSEQIAISNTNGEKAIVTATFSVKEPPYTGKYSYELITSVGDHGSLTVDRYATEGDEVTITVTPDDAYLLDALVVTANGKDVELVDNGDGTFSFTMPSADVRISATFAEDPDWTEPEEPTTDVSAIFLDVAPNAWYKDAVQYAYDNGLMTGVSDTEFAPEATTTRAMIVSILARLEDVTSAQAAGFADVSDEWYATAVNWAASVGVVNGYEDGTFKPNTAITREQLAAILMNYAAYKGEDVSARADLSAYSDQPSTWATETMQWAVAEELITGVTNDELQPQSSATRAQVAAILQRFLAE